MPTGKRLKAKETMFNFVYVKLAGLGSKAIIDTFSEFACNYTFDIGLSWILQNGDSSSMWIVENLGCGQYCHLGHFNAWDLQSHIQ